MADPQITRRAKNGADEANIRAARQYRAVRATGSSARMAKDYVALYRSLLQRPSISERETTAPLPRALLAKELNGNGPHLTPYGDRARRAPKTVDLF